LDRQTVAGYWFVPSSLKKHQISANDNSFVSGNSMDIAWSSSKQNSGGALGKIQANRQLAIGFVIPCI
jgi:hypothetical protein